VTKAGEEGNVSRSPVVVLAGPGDAGNIVYNYLRPHFPSLVMVREAAPSRTALARRRATRLGWVEVVGQSAFVLLAMPLLRRRSRRRITEILRSSGLDSTPVEGALEVESVNSPETIFLLTRLAPSVVVVQGTRIIARAVLEAVGAQFVNLHAGITPRFRGVHGGYWAFAEGLPELAGSTVHAVDNGIDTGKVLAQVRFEATREDSIATYPYLQLAAGLPALLEQTRRIVGGGAEDLATSRVRAAGADSVSVLRWHPTLWGYVWRRIRRRAR
jgi:phosphoribosylglycinamide formyltransferase-1